MSKQIPSTPENLQTHLSEEDKWAIKAEAGKVL
jgi:hypothetical protein